MSQPHILICDDEPQIPVMVAEYLRPRGYVCTTVNSVASVLTAVAESPPDLIILDVRMPGTDGHAGLRQLREVSRVPVIFMSALSDPIDRIVGLEIGADDFVVKPVELRELDARIKAVLRRGAPPPEQEPRQPRVQVGTCTLDLAAATLYDADGALVDITAMEFALLSVFLRNAGRVLTRDQLLEQAHSRPWDPFDRSIDLRISRLRRKIEPNPDKPSVIRTVRGIGYVFSTG